MRPSVESCRLADRAQRRGGLCGVGSSRGSEAKNSRFGRRPGQFAAELKDYCVHPALRHGAQRFKTSSEKRADIRFHLELRSVSLIVNVVGRLSGENQL